MLCRLQRISLSQYSVILSSLNFKVINSNIRSSLTIRLQLRLIALVGRVFANGPRDRGSIPGRAIPKTDKIVLDTSLLNTQ